MQEVSKKYKSIIAGNHWFDTSVTIGDAGVLVTENREPITFGGEEISVGSGPDVGFDEDMLISVQTKTAAFGNNPTVGNCVSAEIEIQMENPMEPFERRAEIGLYIRAANKNDASEWIQKGVFYIDERKIDRTNPNFLTISIHGYDSMIKAEEFFPENTSMTWPATDIAVVEEIASFIGVSIDSRTREIMTYGYSISKPVDLTCRELLGQIAAAYAGNFVISDTGQLRLVPLIT